MNDTVRIASVTGVDLALKVAGPGARSYAFLIDWHIRALLALTWLLLSVRLLTGAFTWVSEQQAFGYQALSFGIVLPAAAIYLLYHPVLEVFMRGRTPGKRMAGVRIVTEEGAVPTTTALLIRNVLRLLDSLPMLYMVGLVSTMVTQNAVRIGDLAAGTLLVYDAGGTKASAADLARDQDTIARHGLDRTELARELLTRWYELAPDVRKRLSRRLLTDLEGTPPQEQNEAELLIRLRGHVG